MRRAISLGLAAPLLVFFMGGCDELVYPCHSNQNCVIEGVQGACVPAGAGTSYCAFGDGKCPSGYRWDTSAPSAIDNNCVNFIDMRADGGD
jgi:hypothetical protein